MFNTFFQKLQLGKHAQIETASITVLFIAIFYFLKPDDILFIHTNVLIPVLFLSIVSLFYGLGNGLLALLIFSIALFFSYQIFEHIIFLELLVFVLIFGEFRHVWEQKIFELESKNSVIDDQLRRLGNAFYALKVSHDQLEMNYVLSPVNLRGSLETIVKMENASPFKDLHTLLEKTFQIKQFAICTFSQDTPHVESSTTSGDTIDTHDTLYLAALEHGTAAYVSQDVHHAGSYIAAIPFVRGEAVQAMILIEEMPFMAFNQDNLTAVAFIFDFFMYRLDEQKVLAEHPDIFPDLDSAFRFQFIHLQRLYARHKVNSAIIAIKSPSHLQMHLLYEHIMQTSRTLDKAILFPNKEHQYVLLVLTPFLASESARGLLLRILETIQDKAIPMQHTVFSISQIDLLNEFMALPQTTESEDD